MNTDRTHWSLWLFAFFLIVPLYWLVTMALRPSADIVSAFVVVPTSVTFANFGEIFTNPVWYQAFANSLTFVAINTMISVAVALPAAKAVSRYTLLGDRQLFLWLRTNRMAPPGVFQLPVLQH
jgi:glycerol transport system permease protein